MVTVAAGSVEGVRGETAVRSLGGSSPPTPRSGNGDKAGRVPRDVVQIRRSDVPHVYSDGERLYTASLDPGTSVYGERLVRQGEVEYREWNPNRSKLAALLKKGVGLFPFDRRTDVLYLGAAQGTTVSHLSDIVAEGTIYAVEISRRAIQKLLDLSNVRHNVMPILGDAAKPEAYARVVTSVDVVYQDVAQRDQVGIFRKNLRFLRPGGSGILIVKARSVDSGAPPSEVYRQAEKELRAEGLDVLQVADLAPYERDHAACLVEKS